MKKFSVNLDPGWACTVVGELWSSKNVQELSQDMLEVHCSGGITIEAGWEPDSSPGGRYVIAVTRGLSHVVPAVKRATAEEAVAAVEAFAERFSAPQLAVSNASSDFKDDLRNWVDSGTTTGRLGMAVPA